MRAVIYVCPILGDRPNRARERCQSYARSVGWRVEAVVLDANEVDDSSGVEAPGKRQGLSFAVDLVRRRRVGVVLIPWEAAVSPLDGEVAEVSRRIRAAGGTLRVAWALGVEPAQALPSRLCA
jgi:hypothetical protein